MTKRVIIATIRNRSCNKAIDAGWTDALGIAEQSALGEQFGESRSPGIAQPGNRRALRLKGPCGSTSR